MSSIPYEILLIGSLQTYADFQVVYVIQQLFMIIVRSDEPPSNPIIENLSSTSLSSRVENERGIALNNKYEMMRW